MSLRLRIRMLAIFLRANNNEDGHTMWLINEESIRMGDDYYKDML